MNESGLRGSCEPSRNSGRVCDETKVSDAPAGASPRVQADVEEPGRAVAAEDSHLPLARSPPESPVLPAPVLGAEGEGVGALTYQPQVLRERAAALRARVCESKGKGQPTRKWSLSK